MEQVGTILPRSIPKVAFGGNVLHVGLLQRFQCGERLGGLKQFSGESDQGKRGMIMAGRFQAMALIAFAALTIPIGHAVAQSINVGDDQSAFANDGECDDVRFAGPGMSRKPTPRSRVLETAQQMMKSDNEFLAARGMDMLERGLAEQTRLDEGALIRAQVHILHDATDCQAAFLSGRIQVR